MHEIGYDIIMRYALNDKDTTVIGLAQSGASLAFFGAYMQACLQCARIYPDAGQCMHFTFRFVVDNAYCHAFVHGRSDRDDFQNVLRLRQVDGQPVISCH